MEMKRLARDLGVLDDVLFLENKNLLTNFIKCLI